MNLYSHYYDNQNSIYNIHNSILEKLKEQNAQGDMKEQQNNAITTELLGPIKLNNNNNNKVSSAQQENSEYDQ